MTFRCSAISEELEEPMAGTADHRPRWLLVEDRSAWGRKAVKEVLGKEVERAAKSAGFRLVLGRQRSGEPEADPDRRRVLMANGESGEMRSGSVASLRELEDVIEDPSAFGEAIEGPIFAVCTNGKRDACCALRGRALHAVMAAAYPDRTWECTHLGGHRFAATMAVLPHGLVYGRVGPADGPRLAAATLDGRLEPGLLRGRSAWPAPAQVAEVELRGRLHLDGIDDLRLVSAEMEDDVARVVLAARDGAEHRLSLRRTKLDPPRPVSCAADDAEQPAHWVVEGAFAGTR